MSISSKKIGQFGEKIAEKYLKKKGYQMLGKNYEEGLVSGPSRGEIDIIAKKDGAVIFVEVKTLLKNRRPGTFSDMSPEDKVDFKKQRKLIKTAQSWLAKNRIPLDSKWQIDVVAVRVDLDSKKAKIRHFKNAVC